jgi:DUF4097 and DUF4098 domain-containing protein YvlB
MSEAQKMILNMLAEGKITVEESEKLLAALGKKEEQPEEQPEKQTSQNTSEQRENKTEKEHKAEWNDREFNPFRDATKLGFDLRNLAQTVQQTVQHAIKKAEPRSREFKDKMKEFGTWMQEVVGTMANEMGQMKGDPLDGVSVDFVATPPEGIAECNTFIFENLFGEIRIHEGDEFKIHVNGRVSKKSMAEYQPSQWFVKNGMRISENTLFIGFDKNQSIKALLDMEITLPADMLLNCKTVSSTIRIRGRYKIGELKTISGNIRVQGSVLKESLIETVSGNVQIEGGEIDLQIKSTSGDFIVRSSKIENLRINSVSGDILLTEASISEQTRVNLITTSGDIIVEKMTGAWSQVEAITRSGETILDWKGDATPLNNQGTCLKSGSEGANFKAESVSGDIQFS